MGPAVVFRLSALTALLVFGCSSSSTTGKSVSALDGSTARGAGGVGGSGGAPGSGGAHDASGVTAASGGASTTVLALADGGVLLFDRSCPTVPGPRARGLATKLGEGPTTIYGCCRPSGQCGLMTTATDLPLQLVIPIAPSFACVSYAELAETGFGLCDGGTPALSEGPWYAAGCFTVLPDPDRSCDYSLDAGEHDASAR